MWRVFNLKQWMVTSNNGMCETWTSINKYQEIVECKMNANECKCIKL